jgi:hypothetical protein
MNFNNRRAFLKKVSGLTVLSPLSTMPLSWAASAPPGAETAAKPDREPLGFKPHPIRQGDGNGGWIVRWGEVQPLRCGTDINTNRLCPFGLAQMDNGEVAFVGIVGHSTKREQPVIGFSRDGGNTWSELKPIDEKIFGRPMTLDYLGNGVLTFQAGWEEGGKPVTYRFFSRDYGRTWPERVAPPIMHNGYPLGTEGNTMVERDDKGIVTKMATFGWVDPPKYKYPQDAAVGGIAWSSDGGRTWSAPITPKEWLWQEESEGKSYLRGVSEGSLVRAANGWIVAALRTDQPPRYFDVRNDDSLEGTGISISKDDGKTWSPLKRLYDAGRHHAHLLRLPNHDLVMTLIVRDDIEKGRLVSYRRGCDALVSHDHGLTWNLDRKYILDEFEFYDGDKWFNGETGHLYSTLLSDGRILTAYGNYITKSAILIRWTP